MGQFNTDQIIAFASMITATGVIVMLYQSWLASKNLYEFKKNITISKRTKVKK